MPKLTTQTIEKFATRALELRSPKWLLRRKCTPVSPQGLEYATFNRRMLASTIDAALMTFVLLPFNDLILNYANSFLHVDNAALQGVVSRASNPSEANMMAAKILLDGGLIRYFSVLMQIQFTVLAAFSFLFWHFYGATPGKLLLRMKIVDAKTGKKLSDTQSILRVLAYLVAGVPLMLGFFAIGWNRQRRGWHDRIAGTAVVILPRGSQRAISAPTADRPSDSPGPEASA